jgi:phosphoglycolate phosphatase
MSNHTPLPAAVFFDLDGTLADTAPDLAGVLNQLRALSNLPPLPTSELRPYISTGVRGLLHKGLNIQPEDPTYEPLQRQFLDLYEQTMYRGDTQLFPGVTECLAALDAQNIRWGIVTNKYLRLATPLLDNLGLRQRAACLVCGDSAARAKPHPDPLLLAARIVGVNCEQCVYIGDDERDIVAAHAAGMRGIAAAWGYLGSDKPIGAWGAEMIIDSPMAFFHRVIATSASPA